ncbi:arylsulfatase A-like enzyme [Lewinella marina]|uniref:Sulfatase N-terminal domain-containing protein n=1 Tax=Neolewinella marina TaxID=438751 RepID=A0A2G0CKG4_9BACT|nr:sulfatase-like hydrolase/transferase [Neolewinella marina]NJB84341.1 arylsulfatase A-like enzyme [Neolewinella marina]PHL00459.1 hypothetical protein CGL56_05355 [Neolewinella marina]
MNFLPLALRLSDYCFRLPGLMLLATVVAVGCRTTAESSPPAERPNVLILFTDDQRYTAVGAQGIEEVATPATDGLMAEGTSFTNSYILGAPHGAVCSPSRAMLMTGRHYFNLELGVYAAFAVADSLRGESRYLTFPEYFKANGYRTFATGKQHNGRQWIERGFEEGRALFLGGMTTHFGTRVADFAPGSGWSEPYADEDKFSSEVFADAAVDFLQRDTSDDAPFLMYVAFTAPHDPRTAPEAYHDSYPAAETELPVNFLEGHPFPIADMKIRDEKLAAFPRRREEVQQHLADYYAMITATDAQIQRVLDALEASGQADNTIVVFSSDNGLAVGQHGLLGKQSVYEHSVKVPLVFRGPGIPENHRVDALAYLHDVFPTLCELIGLPVPESVQTESLAPVLKQQEAEVRESMHYGYNAGPNDQRIDQRGAHRAVRQGDYKLIVSSKDGVVTHQLFNLAEDPWEMDDLSGNAELEQKKAELLAELKSLIEQTGDPAELDQDMFGLFATANQ